MRHMKLSEWFWGCLFLSIYPSVMFGLTASKSQDPAIRENPVIFAVSVFIFLFFVLFVFGLLVRDNKSGIPIK